MNRQEHANQITNTLYSVMNSNSNGHLEQKKLLEGILEKLSQICGILSGAMKEEKPEPKAEKEPDQLSFSFDVTPEAPRKALRLKDAREQLGGFAHKSLEFLISRGAEGYRDGGKCYIYEDSISNIKASARGKKPKSICTEILPQRTSRAEYMSLTTLYTKLKDKYTFTQLKNLCIDLGVFMGYKKSSDAGNWYLKRTEAEKLLKELRA